MTGLAGVRLSNGGFDYEKNVVYPVGTANYTDRL